MDAILVTIVMFIVLFPFIHVLVSNRSHGGAKFGWFLAVFFFSYIGWLVFLIVTQNESDQRKGA